VGIEGLDAAGPAAGRPNIFALYEDTIGLVTPILAEALREAEAEYPAAWLERAFRVAAENNARRWNYVRAILERWAREGVDDEGHRRDPGTDRERDSEGPYAAWIER
jgi:DnaD/phage-associated family protein